MSKVRKTTRRLGLTRTERIAVGDRLQKLRENTGASLKQVAKVCDITRRAYSYYESGRANPGFRVLLLLADHFGVSLDFLLRGV